MTEREHYFLQRKRKKIKLHEIANQIGCSVALLSMYENGKTQISPDKERKYKQFIEN